MFIEETLMGNRLTQSSGTRLSLTIWRFLGQLNLLEQEIIAVHLNWLGQEADAAYSLKAIL